MFDALRRTVIVDIAFEENELIGRFKRGKTKITIMLIAAPT